MLSRPPIPNNATVAGPLSDLLIRSRGRAIDNLRVSCIGRGEAEANKQVRHPPQTEVVAQLQDAGTYSANLGSRAGRTKVMTVPPPGRLLAVIRPE
jgi:hypothetical protein